jgi:TolB-like protein/tetratricopeptide (TPR) repeat protein
MTDTPSAQGKNADPTPNEPRLESWGEIASYLRRDIRTVQRWEKEQGLPVRRLKIGKLGQVYAYRSELDKWILERQPRADAEEPSGAKDAPQSGQDGFRGIEFDERKNQKKDPPPSRSLWKKLTAGLALLVVGFLVFLVYTILQNQNPVPGKTLLFVRPFKNQSGDPNQQQFVSGLIYEMITELGRLDPKRLGVFAPSTSEALADKPIPSLKRQLNANYVLEGSVRRANDQLRIDVTLVSTDDQQPKWSNSYAGDLRDSLRFQDEVTADVAKQIGITLPASSSGSRSSAKREVDPVVYEAYLEGRLYWFNRDFPLSMAAYQRALQKDPEYAPALAGIAGTYLLLGQSPNDVWRPEAAMQKARDAAQQALAKDPTIADAHSVLANLSMSYDHNMAEAERLYRRALELDPSNVTAHEWYGDYLIVRGRLPEAEKQTERARELDPASPLFNTVRAEVYYFQRDYDAALKQATSTLDQHPTFMLTRLWLACAYREKKMYPQAIEQFDLLRRQTNNLPAMLMLYGHVLGLSGDKTAARGVLEQLKNASQTRYVPAIYFAGVYTGLGDFDQAFQWLDKAYEERDDRLIYLQAEPMADPLRKDPRFAALMKRIGLA